MYAIKVNKTGRYVYGFWDTWFETCEHQINKFSKSEVDDFVSKMAKYYISNIEIIDENNNAEKYSNIKANNDFQNLVSSINEDEWAI